MREEENVLELDYDNLSDNEQNEDKYEKLKR